jgi:hypothetical protein
MIADFEIVEPLGTAAMIVCGLIGLVLVLGYWIEVDRANKRDRRGGR